jgi:hypothetical protein
MVNRTITYGGTLTAGRYIWSGRWGSGNYYLETALTLPSGRNLNLAGTAIINIDSSSVSGIISGDSYASGVYTDGVGIYARIWYNTQVYVQIDSTGADVYSSVQSMYFGRGGGLAGS